MRLSLRGSFCTGLSFALLLTVYSCKKDKKESPVTPTPVTPSPVASASADLIRDSIYLYAKQLYYWNDALPSYETFNPRQYNTLSTDLANFQKELFDITRLKINPATGKSYEYLEAAPSVAKYSHMELKTVSGGTSGSSPITVHSANLDGINKDFGFEYNGAGASSSSYSMYFLFVNPSSPAYKAGLGRGDVIRKVNGQTIGTNYSGDLVTLDNALSQSTVTLDCTKKTGEAVTVTLTKAQYTTSPVLKDSVYTAGGRKIGYLMYLEFSSEANTSPALTKSFKRFSDAGITDLVVDLRYNGGGYGTAAQQLCNLIAPASVNGSVMYTETYNATMTSGNATLLTKQPVYEQNGTQRVENGRKIFYSDIDFSTAGNTRKFVKQGSNNAIQKVVFIVSGNTASASELVINSLKPYMDVQLVGSTTYGKPIGFFPVYIDKYEVYYSMIGVKNSAGTGDYFAGFPVNSEQKDNFYGGYDFGNTGDFGLKAAISYIATGGFGASVTVSSGKQDVQVFDETIHDSAHSNFRGLIVDQPALKK